MTSLCVQVAFCAVRNVIPHPLQMNTESNVCVLCPPYVPREITSHVTGPPSSISMEMGFTSSTTLLNCRRERRPSRALLLPPTQKNVTHEHRRKFVGHSSLAARHTPIGCLFFFCYCLYGSAFVKQSMKFENECLESLQTFCVWQICSEQNAHNSIHVVHKCALR